MKKAVQKSTRHISGYSLAVMATLVLLATPFSNVQAQSSDVQALLDRMNRLEADLNNVQLKVYQGQDIPASGSTAGSATNLGSREGVSVLSSRIDGLEDEQRRMTGSSEEVNFKLNQLTTRLNKLVLDIDYRLSEIERKLSGERGAPANIGEVRAPNTALQPASNSDFQRTAPPANSTGTVVAGGELPKGVKLLGTLNASASTGAQLNPAPGTNTAAPNPSVASIVQPVGSPAEQYNRAMSLLRKDNYVAAEVAFTSFLELNNTHALAGNAQYWLGETFYVRGDYNNAASSFLTGYQNYPQNTKAADNLLKLAMTLGRMEQLEEACATFQQLSKQFSNLPARLKRLTDREKLKFNCS